MTFARFAAMVLLVAVVCAEAPLQQPARDGRILAPSPAQLAAEANGHYRAGQWALAVSKYESVLAVQPNLAEARFFLGHAYLQAAKQSAPTESDRQAHLLKAVTNLRLAAERDPDPKIRKLAREYLVTAFDGGGLDDPASAIPVLQQLLAQDPLDARTYAALAKVYEDAGRVGEAEGALVKACAVAPEDAELRRQLAGFYNRRGNFAKVMAALNAAAALEPDRAEGYQLIASYYWEKAFRDRRISPEQKTLYVNKGIEAADRALELNPENAEAVRFRDLLLQMR